MRAGVVAVKLAAGAPGDEQGDAPEDQQGRSLGPRDAVTGPPGEEGERKQLTEPEAEATDEEDLPDGPHHRSAMQRREGHQQRADEEAPEGCGLEFLAGILFLAMAAERVVGEARLQALGDRVARERRAGDGVELTLTEIKLGPLARVPLRQVLEVGAALRIGFLVLDAANVLRGVVGGAQRNLAEAESIRLDGDECLTRTGVADDFVGGRRGADDVAEVGTIRPTYEIPAEARDVGLEAGRVGKAGALDFLERERGGKTQRDVVTGETLLDRFRDRVGGERRARVSLQLWRRLRRGAPILERFLESRVAAQRVDVLRCVFAGKDAGADDLFLIVERHEHVTRAGVAEDAVGIRGGRDQSTQTVTVLVLDQQRLVGTGLQALGAREKRLGVIESQPRQRGFRDGSRALQQQGGQQQRRKAPALDQPGADAGRWHPLVGEDQLEGVGLHVALGAFGREDERMRAGGE